MYLVLNSLWPCSCRPEPLARVVRHVERECLEQIGQAQQLRLDDGGHALEFGVSLLQKNTHFNHLESKFGVV